MVLFADTQDQMNCPLEASLIRRVNNYLDCKYLYYQCVHLKMNPSLWIVSEFKIKKARGMDVSLSLCESPLKHIIFVLTV